MAGECTVPLAEAAQQLGISWERAWRHVLTGELEGEKRDGRWRVTTSSVRALKRRLFIAKNEHAAR
jgi:hypothetical protein